MASDLRIFCIPLNTTLIEAVQQIDQNRMRCVFVQDENRIVGVISEGDVMRALLRGMHLHSPVQGVMKPSFRYLSQRDMPAALAMVRSHYVTLIPVIDEHFHLIDMITLPEVIAYLEEPRHA